MHEYIAYHGTNSENVASLRRVGFKPSTSHSEWLGRGAYFFIGGSFCPIKNARDWAIASAWDKAKKKYKYEKYTILKTKVRK